MPNALSEGPSALPEDSVARFKTDLTALTGTPDGQRYGLCVSGGPDSLALLLLAHRAGIEAHVATVDHRLRPEAAVEAADVAALCATLGLPHVTLRLEGAPEGNVSAWARQARYSTLSAWAQDEGLDWLLTAHHADDQLETLLMRLNRGAGVAGLAGVRARREGIARPLLGWRKAELVALVQVAAVSAVQDPSNTDDRYDRARLRKALAAVDWLDPIAANRSATALAEAEDALNWAAQNLAKHHIEARDDLVAFEPADLPRELKRRLVLICLGRIMPEANPRGAELDRLLVGLSAGKVATLAGVRCTGGAIWRFSKASPHRA